jgi:hypothetical protein
LADPFEFSQRFSRKDGTQLDKQKIPCLNQYENSHSIRSLREGTRMNHVLAGNSCFENKYAAFKKQDLIRKQVSNSE